MKSHRSVRYKELNRVPYKEAWDYQTALHQELIERKLKNRKASPLEPVHHYLLLCEHNPVYTLGKSGSMDHLLLSEEELESSTFEFFKINRGGDITYHGPGQITGYPIFDLDDFFTDVHKYVRYLEEVVIRTIGHFGIKGERIKDFTGVWVKPEQREGPYRKICAIGVHLSRWVTMHGFALNVHPNLQHFNNIIPCGITDENKVVTSMEKETGCNITMTEVKHLLRKNFAELFEYTYSSEY